MDIIKVFHYRIVTGLYYAHKSMHKNNLTNIVYGLLDTHTADDISLVQMQLIIITII